MQYCSLKDSNVIFNVFKILHRLGTRAYGILAHFSFHPSMITSSPARYDPFFQDFNEHGIMKYSSILRGE